MRSFPMLGVFVLLVALAGWCGSLFLPGAWYFSLNSPPLNPPGWVFGPVWSVLYLCMALAAWMVWRSDAGRSGPLVFWGIQLAFNALWSFLFFGLHRPGLALVEIICLWALVALTAAAFFRISRPAGWLLVPYLLWVSFATYLNAGFWYLNA